MTSTEIVGKIIGFVVFAFIVYFVMPFFDKKKISKQERVKKAVLLSCVFTILDLIFNFSQ